MVRFSGKPVYKGIAMGPVIVLKKREVQYRPSKVHDIKAELERLQAGIRISRVQLEKLYEKTLEKAGEAGAEIFKVHRMMLEDEDYVGAITTMIRGESVNVEYAVARTRDNFVEVFANMDDEYMKARGADVKDISDRLLQNLTGAAKMDLSGMEPSIICAEDITPSELVQADKKKILGFVTTYGSVNSHTSILARMMKIPALVGVPVDLNSLENGMEAIVDGITGEVIFEPDEMVSQNAQKLIGQEREKVRLLQVLKGKDSVTKSGRCIRVCANIGGIDDISYALENDAEGIGLFRSEFLYLGRKEPPTEEEQFQTYKTVLHAMGKKKVIIRTMDIGADKKVDYFNLGEEENPALGYRGIRICLKQPDIFKTQLRALLRASSCGNLSIMYPMIISVDEVKKIYEIVNQVSEELDKAGIPHKIPEQGIMIETPASVMVSDELARTVDFFSIGTNDLTQYTLAIDRQNDRLRDFCDMHHPAILRMIRMAINNAHQHGKWVGICGELGGDLELTETFVKMGIDELSVSPPMILPLRKKIREIE